MMNRVNSQVYTDLNIIINMMPKEMKNKINPKLIEFIEKNQSKTYCSEIKANIPLKQQKIREETKEMLGILYRDYLCEQKEELIRQEEEELIKIEEENRKKYNPDNLFPQKELKKEENINIETQMIEYKKTVFTKLVEFFKKILNNKNFPKTH